MDIAPLLENSLRQLRLPSFIEHYQHLAEEAAQANMSYERFLLALAEQELAQRTQQRQSQCIKQARFPVLKELADFDFSAIPSLNRARVLDLARGHYIGQAETILLIGNPGLGKPQPLHYLLWCERFLICLVVGPAVCFTTSALLHRTMCWQSPASAHP